jgi:hypothetical protein
MVVVVVVKEKEPVGQRGGEIETCNKTK